jgi:hypothetical protein
MKKWIVFISTLALSLGFGIGSAFAAGSGWAGGTAPQYVLTHAVTGQTSEVGSVSDLIYTLQAGESLATNDTITITLTGGATFSDIQPTLKPSAGDLGNGTAATVPLTGGTKGSTTATWRVVSGLVATDTLTLNASTKIFDVSGVAKGNKADITITLNVGGDASRVIGNTANHSYEGDTTHYLFIGDDASTAKVATAPSDTIDVSASTGAYTQILVNGAGLDTVNSGIAEIDVKANSMLHTIPTSSTIAAGKVLITLTGDFSGVKEIDETTGSLVKGCDSTGVTTNGKADQFLINADKTAAYALTTVDVVAGAGREIKPQFVFDGTTAQKTSTFTATVDVSATTGTWDAYTPLTATAVYTMTRNGVYFSANSLGALNTIKITDRSGNIKSSGGAIHITAYDKSGVVIAEDSGAAALTVSSYGTTTITGAQLQAMFPSATPVLYEFSVETSNAVISNVKKTADGTNVTVYTKTDGGAL